MTKPKPKTLTDVLTAYWRSTRVRSAGKPRTLQNVERHIRVLESHFPQSTLAEDITPADIEDFIAVRLEQGVAVTTVNASLRILKAALRRSDFQTPVKLLREGKRIPYVYTQSEIQCLIDNAQPPADLAILLAARAGLRHQEILHLQRSDVDLVDREVRVTAKPGWSPKSHAERAVPIGGQLEHALLHQLDLLDLARRTDPHDWLFLGLEGTQRASIYGPVREAFKACSLYDPSKKSGLHALRRSWATELLGRGADIETVRQLGGWADLKVVQSYVTSTDERKRAAIAALEETHT